MENEPGDLVQAARQLIETDMLLGGDFMPANRNPLPMSEPANSTAAAKRPTMTPQQKTDLFKKMDADEVKVCTKCILAETRTNTVFGECNPDADLVFVGEGPGADEDRTGRPFVGRAGELLTKMIHAMGLTREDVFICNIVKCRPPNNRAPAPEEVESCWGYLVRQLQIIQPKVIVTLGNPATQNLLNTRVGITKLRGQWQELPDIGDGLAGTAVMPTFHPAYVLRQYTPDNRKKVWDDLKKVMQKLDIKPPKK